VVAPSTPRSAQWRSQSALAPENSIVFYAGEVVALAAPGRPNKGILSMLKKFAALGLCLMVPTAFQAHAADETVGPFACTFDQGTNWSYDGGKFQSAAPAKLSFEIDGIDLEVQKAQLLIDGKPSGALRVIRALNANHYLEVANEGFLNLTTIYDRDETSGVYPAVHSRHFGILGQPVFAQYAGTCVAKDAK
jgi:hypothetical protein